MNYNDKFIALQHLKAFKNLYLQGDGMIIATVEGTYIPTEEELLNALLEVKSLEYREKRASEYPTIGDQLGALMKGGQELIDIQAQVQAVKDKYPKT